MVGAPNGTPRDATGEGRSNQSSVPKFRAEYTRNERPEYWLSLEEIKLGNRYGVGAGCNRLCQGVG